MASLGFSINMSSVNRVFLLLAFQSECLLFLIAKLHELERLVQCWIEVTRAEIFDIGWKLSVFTSKYCVRCGFFINGLYHVEGVPFSLVCFIKGCGLMSNFFSASIRIIMNIFSFILLMWCIISFLNQLRFCVKFHMVMVHNPLNMLLGLVC